MANKYIAELEHRGDLHTIIVELESHVSELIHESKISADKLQAITWEKATLHNHILLLKWQYKTLQSKLSLEKAKKDILKEKTIEITKEQDYLRSQLKIFQARWLNHSHYYSF